MKNLFFLSAITLILNVHNSFACEPINIITDIDDTIKQTDVLHKVQTIINGLKSDVPAFPLMNDLYSAVLNKCKSEGIEGKIFYISASPRFTKEKLEKFLEDNKFPKGVLIQKNWVFPGLGYVSSNYDHILSGTKEYKIKAISAVIEKFKNEKFILLGDNSEFDPETYESIYTKFKNNISSVFIRHIRGGSERFGIEFSTTTKLASEMYSIGIISLMEFGHVLESETTMIKNNKIKAIIPSYIQSIRGKEIKLSQKIIEKLSAESNFKMRSEVMELLYSYNKFFNL